MGIDKYIQGRTTFSAPVFDASRKLSGSLLYKGKDADLSLSLSLSIGGEFEEDNRSSLVVKLENITDFNGSVVTREADHVCRKTALIYPWLGGEIEMTVIVPHRSLRTC